MDMCKYWSCSVIDFRWPREKCKQKNTEMIKFTFSMITEQKICYFSITEQIKREFEFERQNNNDGRSN
jgi:hypothetical protein